VSLVTIPHRPRSGRRRPVLLGDAQPLAEGLQLGLEHRLGVVEGEPEAPVDTRELAVAG